MQSDELPLFFKKLQDIHNVERKKTMKGDDLPKALKQACDLAYEKNKKEREMSDKETPPEIKKLLELYQNSVLVKHGAPDEYQYHQNKLTKGLAEFILNDYLNK